MHYYYFNIADYRKDTMHLVPIEHYIYRELLDWYYLDEEPIPNKTKLVLRLLRLTKENEENLNNVLHDFFDAEGDVFRHKRVEKEINHFKERQEIARENGKKGGRPKGKIKTKSVYLANPSITESKTNQEPITNNQEPVVKATIQGEAPDIDISTVVDSETGEIIEFGAGGNF